MRVTPTSRLPVTAPLGPLLGIFLLGCIGSDSRSISSGDSGAPDASDDSGVDEDTDDTADCEGLAQLPLLEHTRTDTVGTEDFAFDAHGNMIVVNDGSLLKVNKEGEVQVVAVGLGSWIRGTRVLADGNYVIANCETGTLDLVKTTGEREVIVSGIGLPNGIAVGIDGILYVTTSEGFVLRVDPNAKTVETFADIGMSLDGITFNAGHDALYVCTEELYVYEIPIEDDGAAVEVELFVYLEDASDILDGMAADECGNIYVVDMIWYVWMITPDGQIEKVVDKLDSVSSTAVNFGSGFGGWERDHIYVQSMEGFLFDMDMGVDGKDEPHLP